jgi:hypothetical protein
MIVASRQTLRSSTVGQPRPHELFRDAAQVSRPNARKEVDTDAACGKRLADHALNAFGSVMNGVRHLQTGCVCWRERLNNRNINQFMHI